MEDMDFTLDGEKYEQKSFWWRGHGEARQDISGTHAADWESFRNAAKTEFQYYNSIFRSC